ncbi:hydrolase 1, exosortase A system-associated [Azohydromonas aeria]|uniref:hydrolase 1, exosortase A system-associated n=1 Tax=Azohydromonas aeria TaxID=2590212 RepID=UPI0012FB8254|nr:hydrolase 1, exosortase A system-associated [Azohydromonas aeria]
MSWTEQALGFDCLGHQLLGVLAEPAPAPLPGDVGVVIVVGGPQYRAGSHRLFVKLARALAQAGVPALRFDVRGMGDSEGDFPGFERLTPDIGAAIAALQSRRPEVRRVLLWGLCDGASAALLYLHDTRDARVHGLCLLNPWVRSPQAQARTNVKHYYAQRLLEPDFWRRLLGGRIGAQALRGLAANLALAWGGRRGGADSSAANDGFQQRMARAWNGFGGELLLLLSGDDYTAKEFLEHCAGDAQWRAALRHARLQRATLPRADHTFSGTAATAWVLERTLAWAQGPLARAPAATTRPAGSTGPVPCA